MSRTNRKRTLHTDFEQLLHITEQLTTVFEQLVFDYLDEAVDPVRYVAAAPVVARELVVRVAGLSEEEVRRRKSMFPYLNINLVPSRTDQEKFVE